MPWRLAPQFHCLHPSCDHIIPWVSWSRCYPTAVHLPPAPQTALLTLQPALQGGVTASTGERSRPPLREVQGRARGCSAQGTNRPESRCVCFQSLSTSYCSRGQSPGLVDSLLHCPTWCLICKATSNCLLNAATCWAPCQVAAKDSTLFKPLRVL